MNNEDLKKFLEAEKRKPVLENEIEELEKQLGLPKLRQELRQISSILFYFRRVECAQESCKETLVIETGKFRDIPENWKVINCFEGCCYEYYCPNHQPSAPFSDYCCNEQ